jgi:hypothetical protein
MQHELSLFCGFVACLVCNVDLVINLNIVAQWTVNITQSLIRDATL